MYGFQFSAVLFATKRLKKGLPATFEVRKQCAQETFKCLLHYDVYLFILVLFFIPLVSHTAAQENESWNTYSKVFLYLVSCRGYVDGLVWFGQHDFARDDRSVVKATESSSAGGGQDVGSGDGEIELGVDGKKTKASKRQTVAGLIGGFADALNDLAEHPMTESDELDLSPQVCGCR
jgi:hypothetical protein